MAVIYAFIKGTSKNVQSKLFVRKKYSNHRRNRPHFSANGPFLLLPLALKWGLSILFAIVIVPCIMAKGAYAASLTVEVPRDPLSVTVSADGTAKESSPANVTVTSDAYWGYTLSVKSNDANGALTNGNSKINPIGTGITSLSQFTNNTWGFKVSGEGVTDPNNYRQSPTTATTNLAVTTGQKGSQETGTYSFTFAAKVDNTIPAGTYTGVFTFTATANAVNYTINYDDNDGVDGPGKVTSQSQEQFVKIAAKEPTKQDRVFLGWCDQEVSNNGTCDGTIYQPGNDYEIKTADQNTTLHAMWDWITMQNWDDCSKNLAKNKQFTLVDSRDNKPYYIAKLADDNCWMTENLDYDIVAGVTLTAETTDLGYATDEDKGENVDEYGNYQWTPDKSTYKNVEYTLWKNDNNIQQSYDPGEKCWNGIILTKDGGLNSSTETCSQHDSSHFFLGNYYDYGAAVAQNSTSIKTKNGDKYETSICPAGWRLPEKDGDPSYINLFTQSEKYGYEVSIGSSGNIHKPPFYLFYDGGSDAKGVFQMGVKGLYRTNAVSAINGDNASYVLETHAGILAFNKSHYGGRRYHGFSVRCVTRL